MIDRQLLRNEPERTHDALAARNVEDTDIDRIPDVYDEWCSLKTEGDDLRHERSGVNQQIGQLKQEGKDEEAQEVTDHSGELREELRELETRADELETELDGVLMELPNFSHEPVPVGADGSDNEKVRRVGFDDLRELSDEATPYYDLGEELDTINKGRVAKTTDSGFYFLEGEDATSEHTLVQFMLDVRREQEYADLFPPIPVKATSMEDIDQLPKSAKDTYRIGGAEIEDYDDDNLQSCLTTEVPVTNMCRDEILLKDDLPLKHQAYTPNFQHEAGEYGTETRGTARAHQFNRVGFVNLVEPDESYDRLEALADKAAEMPDRLGLPYRVLSLCTSDLTSALTKTYDPEVWTPGTEFENAPEQDGRWLEVSSALNFENLQVRRAGLRYYPGRHESAECLHTLNASDTAVGRVMVALLECYQNEDGTVDASEPLQPYMSGREVIEGHEPVGEAAVGAGRKD